MLVQYFPLAALLCLAAAAAAQEEAAPPIQVHAGYSWLSNSFNGVPGSQSPLNGWNADVAFPPWRHLRFKIDYSMYRGVNAGAPQHAFFIMGGGQYEAMIHRERFYAEALVGEGGLNGTWFNPNPAGYVNGNTGMHASLAEFLGGGIDTPVNPHFAIRVEGGVQHSGFEPIETLKDGAAPYHLDGIPSYFGRFSVGMVWMPKLGSAIRPTAEPSGRAPVESELVFEGMTSIGHFHILANSWWSYLNGGGIEYDRHSWGTFIGARVDYSADIVPVLILRQPSKTDIWGNRLSHTFENVPGVGISPIGMRLLWFDGRRLKPYYYVKLGMTGYTEKSFSQYAAYENFSLRQSVGLQVKLTDRVDFRGGFEVFHQSDGFVVPSNPGLDEMMLDGGICYRLGHARGGN